MKIHARPKTAAQPAPLLDVTDIIPLREWRVQEPALKRLRAEQIPFVLGGGLAFSAYALRRRNTKDLDLFILPADRDAAIEAATAAGFVDYYDQLPYDRSWIYRGYRKKCILDLIWTMPNHRFVVDDDWAERGREITVHGEALRLVPLEELICSKLYVLQFDRSDWPDCLNLLVTRAAELDWERLLARLGEDAGLLGGLMCVYRWICPSQAGAIPAWVWPRVGLQQPPAADAEAHDSDRARLLDTRDWFGPQEGEAIPCL